MAKAGSLKVKAMLLIITIERLSPETLDIPGEDLVGRVQIGDEGDS
jgi:hypothetical protein